MITHMNRALEFLRDKYGAPKGTIIQTTDDFQLQLPDGQTVPLLPWRVERRFVELKKIIDSKTLEDVSTFRFASFTAGKDTRKELAKELDLAEWLAESRIIRLYAVGTPKACNVIFRLENGMSGCVEVGNGLPEGTDPVDRHEIIARRGVASDRVVDSQIPQDSIYLWNRNGRKTYTDVDTELFGLPNDAIWCVRAAFAVLADPGLADAWKHAAQRAQTLSDDAFRSAQTASPVESV